MKKERKIAEPKMRYGKYQLFVSDNCKDRFDIFEEITVRKTGKKSKKLIGYGYRFEEVLEKLARVITAEKKLLELKDYVTEFKKARTELLNTLL